MSRLSRHILFQSPTRDPLFHRRNAPADAVPVHDPPLPPREEAIKLLTLGAEVEHALMVQYLFAAYSLHDPADVPKSKAALVRTWRDTIITVAREEMGHLITVQNLLRSLGASLSLGRDEFPIDTEFYPFNFKLEPLSKDSISSYAFAEMPIDDQVAQQIDGVKPGEIADIVKRASRDHAGAPINRVPKLYERITDLVRALPSSAFSAASLSRQAQNAEWIAGRENIVVMPVGSRVDAIHALNAIAEQGEGPLTAQAPSSEISHFKRFLGIYRAFPTDGSWQPSINILKNPNVRTTQPNPSEITHPEARLWAQLFNYRYARLLLSLRHMLELPATTSTTKSPRGLLISWTFGEMYNVRSIANILVKLPATPGGKARAGAPFEMPASLQLPTLEADRFRLNRGLLEASSMVIDQLRALPATRGSEYLAGLRTTDNAAMQVADEVISQQPSS